MALAQRLKSASVKAWRNKSIQNFAALYICALRLSGINDATNKYKEQSSNALAASTVTCPFLFANEACLVIELRRLSQYQCFPVQGELHEQENETP